MDTYLTKTLGIRLPIIMAPMFLVSNEEMLIAANKVGIAGCVPAHNYRTPELLDQALSKLDEACAGAYGVNLIVNKSNPNYKGQMEVCERHKVGHYITSLGNPKEVIKKAHAQGVPVFCDVVDEGFATKVKDLGADALIAVNSGAGGHLGNIPASILVPMLKRRVGMPVITAGGIGTGEALASALVLGAEGASIGSPFIASKECPVNQDYKGACVDYGAGDIVTSTKVSGTPCTVINTDYVKKIGTEQNVFERTLNKNRKLKKYVKMLTFYKGMKLMEKAAFSATYQTVWCAGPSIEFTESEESVADIVARLESQMKEAFEAFGAKA